MTYLRQKVPSYVSKKLRDFARGQDCTLQLEGICNRNPETTVMCHMRYFGMAGVAMKPHDFSAYHGCSDCHAHEKDAGWDELLRAMMQTQARVFAHFGTLTP
jgi:hypothetical protein